MAWETSRTQHLLSTMTTLWLAASVAAAATDVSKERALPGATWLGSIPAAEEDAHEPPEGYYAFIESLNAEPPRVRRPPYQHTNTRCPGIGQVHPHASLDNLCGDLNHGIIPRNPLDQNVMGSSYPFALIKNKTLEFFSKTLPILKEDDMLPKVAKYQQIKRNITSSFYYKDHKHNSMHQRMKREENQPLRNDEVMEDEENQKTNSSNDGSFLPDERNTTIMTSTRQSRKFCDNGGGVICMLYKAFRGEPLASGMGERKDEETSHAVTAQYRRGEVGGDVSATGNSVARVPSGSHQGQGPSPPTPCPSKAEYATPVFARNYQGIWRYVVQIPYEGYFTQTLEVTRCLQSRCHFMDGSCMSSPRWVSLLVAEIFYPDSVFPTVDSINAGGRQPPRRYRPALHSTERPPSPPPIHDFQEYQQYLHRRAGEAALKEDQNMSIAEENAEKVRDDNSGRVAKASGTTTGYCDGTDEIGCFQVRLYYDWFLIPGSCKCWRPDYFSRYTNRKA